MGFPVFKIFHFDQMGSFIQQEAHLLADGSVGAVDVKQPFAVNVKPAAVVAAEPEGVGVRLFHLHVVFEQQGVIVAVFFRYALQVEAAVGAGPVRLAKRCEVWQCHSEIVQENFVAHLGL